MVDYAKLSDAELDAMLAEEQQMDAEQPMAQEIERPAEQAVDDPYAGMTEEELNVALLPEEKKVPTIAGFQIPKQVAAGITGAAQGLTFGMADELKSALRGKPVEQVRAEDMARAEQYPTTTLLSDIGSGIVSGGALLKGLRAPQYIGKAATGAGKIGRAGLLGAGTGATEMFGRGEGGLLPRLQQAAIGGGVGGALGSAIPVLGKATKAVAQKLAPTFSELLEKSGIKKAAQKASEKGTTVFDEADEKAFKSLSDIAKRSEEEGGQLGMAAIDELRMQPTKISSKIKGELGDAVFENIDQAMSQTKGSATPIYQKLSGVPDVTAFAAKDKAGDLSSVLASSEVDDAIQKAMRLNPDLGRKGARHVDTLNAAKNALYQTDRPTADALNRTLKESIPEYKEASAVWSEFKDMEGAELGKKMLGAGTRVKDVERFMAKATPVEKKTALTSFVDDFVEKLKTAKDSTGAINTVKSQAFRDKLSILTADKAKANSIVDILEKEAVKAEGLKKISSSAKQRFPDVFSKPSADGGRGILGTTGEALGDVFSGLRGEEAMAAEAARRVTSPGGVLGLAQPTAAPRGVLGQLMRPVRAVADPAARTTGITPGILSGTLLGEM